MIQFTIMKITDTIDDRVGYIVLDPKANSVFTTNDPKAAIKFRDDANAKLLADDFKRRNPPESKQETLL